MDFTGLIIDIVATELWSCIEYYFNAATRVLLTNSMSTYFQDAEDVSIVVDRSFYELQLELER